jgi:hypothetical protein
MPKHSNAVLRDGVADSGNNGVIVEWFPIMKHINPPISDKQRELHRICNIWIEAAFSRFFDQPSCAVEAGSAGENGQTQVGAGRICVSTELPFLVHTSTTRERAFQVLARNGAFYVRRTG